METYFIAKANDGRASPPIYLCADEDSEKFYLAHRDSATRWETKAEAMDAIADAVNAGVGEIVGASFEVVFIDTYADLFGGLRR